MPLTAISRAVSASMNDCQLAFVERQPIDIGKAIGQHDQYETCLSSLGSAVVSFFFFNDTATTEIYTLSLHDALPILIPESRPSGRPGSRWALQSPTDTRSPASGPRRHHAVGCSCPG